MILVQENRSFDHYFGTYPGVRGFDDPHNRAAFTQPGPDGRPMRPFHLDERAPTLACTPDVHHEWVAQHDYWNGGRMDRFARDGGALSMGYYRRDDIPLHFALADEFTLCDRCFSSVIGPTTPNRLYSMCATLDPGGRLGGPVIATPGEGGSPALEGKLRWATMPESLQARGVSWKAYHHPAGRAISVFGLFERFHRGPLRERALVPSWPGDFDRDLARDDLPAVSWLHVPGSQTEHPEHSCPAAGGIALHRVVRSLMRHPDIWKRTALFVVWDENGGFFDHVPPPVAPRGTRDEYVGGRPIGLGMRVPLLVISPFSRGGFVDSTTYDLTSVLQFVERRFGAEVPLLSDWRRQASGDLVDAFNFARPDFGPVDLPDPALTERQAIRACDHPAVAPIRRRPGDAPLPRQERGVARRPSGPV